MMNTINFTSPNDIVSVIKEIFSSSFTTLFNRFEARLFSEQEEVKLGWVISTSMSPLSAFPRLAKEINYTKNEKCSLKRKKYSYL